MIFASASLSGSYDYSEVARSVLVAIAASYAGLDLAERTIAASGRVRIAWLSGSAAAIGISIWALQFKGMLAFHLPEPVEYSWPKVLASLLLAMVSSALALHVISRGRIGQVEVFGGAVVLGSGVAGVHYTFISALKSPSIIHFSSILVAISILLPIFFSWAGVWMVFAPGRETRSPVRRRLGSAVILGIGLATMRYASIAATSFVPASTANFHPPIGISVLGDNGGAIAALIIIAVVIVTSSVDRKADAEIHKLNLELENRVVDRTTQIRAVNAKLAESEERFRKLVEALPDAVMVHGNNKILFVNSSCLKLLGAEQPEQLLGKDVLEILHPDYRDVVQQCIQLCLDTGTACPAKESIFIALDGSQVQIEAAAIAIPWRGSQAVEVTIRDIRQRKRAEEKLREYEKVVEGLEEMIAVVDRDYRYVLANRAYLNYRGLKRDQILGHLAPDLLDREMFQTLVKPKFDESFQGKAVSYEMKCPYPTLGERDLSVAYLPIEGPSGVDRVACVLRDVTERKRAEVALRQSEERFRLAAQAGKMFAYEWDALTDVIVRSAESAHILGLDDSRALTGQRALTLVHPRDREDLLAAVTTLTPENPTLRISYRVVRPDDSIVWVERNSRAHFAEDGRLLRIVGMVADVTQRKEAEKALQLFRVLIDQSNDGIEVIDPDTLRFIDVNGRSCMDLGYTREELLTMRVRDIDPNVDERMQIRVFAELRESGSAMLESVHRRKDGSTFPVEVSITQVRLDRIYIVSMARDITERKQAELKLQEARSELARVTRFSAMGELTALIAHEINQPLAAIVTNGSAALRWLAAKPPDLREVVEALSATITEANRASEVIAKIRALLQKAPAQMERLDVNTLIREILILTDNELAHAGVTLEMELGNNVPPVLGDHVQLRQVVLNLTVNAIDAMAAIDHRPKKLLIRSQAHSEGALVQVQDSGDGVDPKHADRIFDLLFTTKPQGIGIGLPLSRSIVEAHGGRLWMEPGLARGAVFQFTVPRVN